MTNLDVSMQQVQIGTKAPKSKKDGEKMMQPVKKKGRKIKAKEKTPKETFERGLKRGRQSLYHSETGRKFQTFSIKKQNIGVEDVILVSGGKDIKGGGLVSETAEQ